jgi:hypothetical protein
MKPMVVESAGPCWGGQAGAVTLVDEDRRCRLLLRATVADALEVRKALEQGPPRAGEPPDGARIVAVHLIDQLNGAPMGILLSVDGMGRRARACRPVVAVLCAIAHGLPLWVPDPVCEQWAVPARSPAHPAADTVPPVFRRFIDEELSTTDAL